MIKGIKINLRAYGLINSLSPGLLPLKEVKSVFDALSPFINIYISGMIIDALYQRQPLENLIFLVFIMASANFIISVINSSLNRFINIKSNSFGEMSNNIITQKINSMDYENIENPETHNLRQRIQDIQNWVNGGLPQLISGFENLIKQLFVIIFSITLVFNAFTVSNTQTSLKSEWTFINSSAVSVLVIALIIASVILSMRITSSSTKKSFEMGKGVMLLNRLFIHYGDLINDYKMGKDIRMYNQKAMILKEGWNDMCTNATTSFGKIQDMTTGYTNINLAVSTVISALVYIFVALRALFGLYGIGSIVHHVGGIQQFIGGFSNFMSTVARMHTNIEALELLFQFLDLPNNMYQGTISVEKRDDNEYEIEFKKVSFKYPGSENYALKNLNLKLNIGQRMAVVGMNGSGKTTMIKLLCRLYDPTEGIITLNGIDIKKYDYDEYMAIFSVVFQDFKLLPFTLAQNIAASIDYDSEAVLQTISKSGFDSRLEKMPKGIETYLYKNFEEDGVEISGGEAQKIAIARALYKNAPFIILDEPTAALDPIAEFEIYSKFNEIVGNKTAIYISHRLSSCRFCDDIAVFHEGELIQRGSHDTLVSDESGKYYELWNAQAQYYSDTNNNSNINELINA